MPAPLVSVVIPCFNGGRMLRAALQSVIAQTHPALEIVFVDNGSTDGGMETAERLLAESERPHRIVRCEERGANAARNLGYAFATGDYVNWMDADDLMDADKIARQVAALEAAPGFDIAYGDWSSRWLPPAYPPGETKRVLSQAKDQIHRTLCGVWYPPHLYLLRRGAADRLQAVQAWFPGRKVTTDVEYSAVAALMGLKFLHVPGAHVTYNIWSTGQISGGTPFEERARTLSSVFERLRAFAEAAPMKSLLTARHRMLLNQEWTLWRLPRGSVEIERSGGRRAHIRHVATGREIVLRPWEAAIATAMIESGQTLPSSHWGVFLTEAAEPAADDPADVVEVVEKLRREGFLVRDDLASLGQAPSPQSAR